MVFELRIEKKAIGNRIDERNGEMLRVVVIFWKSCEFA